MAGYLIANIDVKDQAKFEEYRQKVVPVIKKFGGRYLIRGGDVRRLEGNLPTSGGFGVLNGRSCAAVLRQHRVSADPKSSAC